MIRSDYTRHYESIFDEYVRTRNANSSQPTRNDNSPPFYITRAGQEIPWSTNATVSFPNKEKKEVGMLSDHSDELFGKE